MANKLQFLKGTSALPVSRDANNVYFKLGAAGEGQIALGNNIWNESVQIKDGDNVLAYSAADGLSASVSLSYDAEGKKIKLVGKDNANLGEIDATAFLKDGMLESASFENNELIFVFNTDAGKTQIKVPVADLVDEYTAGNGLALIGKEFSVKVAGESFLSVDSEGVKLSGVQDAINAAKSAAISEANVASAAAKSAADAAQADVDTLEQNVAGIDADLTALEGVVNGHIADAVVHITAEERSAWDASEQNAKDYADSLADNYDAAGSAATAKSEAISAAAADAAEKYQVKGNYEAVGAAATAEQNAKDYADSLADNYDAAGSAATAKSEAISAAAADATTKANTAEQNAKDYADSLDSAMDARVDELESVKHSHANKAVLDGIASSNVESWDDAATKAHTHANKDVLDGISSDKVASWDGALASAKSYADSVAAAAQSAAEKTAAADATSKANAAQSAAISAAAADATTKANAAQSAAEKTAAADATSKANAAQSAAISAAAADATTKANAAQSAAEATAAEKYQVKGNYEAAGAADAVKDVIDAYTVNGKAISSSPVLNGGEIKLDGFAAVSQTSAVVASDTINSAIAKLEKSIADVSAAAVKLGTQEGNVVLTIDDTTKGLSAHLEWGEF